MSSEIGVVSFTYIPTELISALEGILSSNGDMLKSICDRYVLLSNDEVNPFHHDCTIIELVKKDIHAVRNPIRALDQYNELIEEYGKAAVDLVVLEDEKIIQNKIADVLKFAMDKVYKSDTIRIEFIRYMEPWMHTSSIPDLIYSAAGENFDIKDQYLLGQQNYIVITRRK